jgi:hypothetical protein
MMFCQSFSVKLSSLEIFFTKEAKRVMFAICFLVGYYEVYTS